MYIYYIHIIKVIAPLWAVSPMLALILSLTSGRPGNKKVGDVFNL
jgi:hypothetical protein